MRVRMRKSSESGGVDDSEDKDWEMKAKKEAVVVVEDEMELGDLG
ncbi:hypothetical protein Tco_0621362, partial [Tanacetum coccineum]